MAFKMKGFNAGKGTGMSPNTMKKGSAMKMKKGSSIKKPLVCDQHKLPQELKAQIKQAPMTLGMRGNAMQGRNPNMAMKASNAMMPGSMMAMKKQNSAMTLKEGAMSGAQISGATGRKRTGDPERRLSKSGQKAKKGEIAMRKGVRSGAREGAAEAMTSKPTAQTPRLAMKTKARKKAQAFPLREASPYKLKDRPTGMKKDPDYYKRDNFMDVKAEAKQAADRKAYGPEGAPATVKPKKGRDTLRTAIPQSTIGKRLKEQKIKYREEGRKYGKKGSSMTLKDEGKKKKDLSKFMKYDEAGGRAYDCINI